MRLLIIAPNEIDGTSWYRVYGVARDLNRFGIDYGQVSGKLNWATIQEYDAVLLQRPFHPDSYKLAALVKESMKPLILDYDDDLLNVHPDNPVHHVFAKEENYAAIQSICNLADGIIVSNEKLIDVYGQWKCKNFCVVPNAIDDKYWSLRAEHNPKSELALYRGSASHIPDVRWLNDVITEKIESSDPWRWHVMGYPVTEFYRNLSEESRHRFTQHEWYNLPPYMRVIHKLNPRFSWFPLQDNDFNQRKSNIMWLESTYAGGALLASKGLDTFDKPGVYTVDNTVDAWSQAFDDVLTGKLDTAELHKKSSEYIENNLLLSVVNAKRAEFIKKIASDTNAVTLAEPHEIASDDVEPYTPKEMADLQINEHSVDNPEYVKLYENFVDAVMKAFKPRSILELGTGTGILIEMFKAKGVDVIGVDSNPHLKEWFDKRNPKLADRYLVEDLGTWKIPEDRWFDLVLGIEVFEHMTGKQIHNIMNQMHDRSKRFIFSSTPNLSSAVFDKKWGHISVLPTKTWIALINNYGMDFQGGMFDQQGKPTPTNWTCVFTSRKYLKQNGSNTPSKGNVMNQQKLKKISS